MSQSPSKVHLIVRECTFCFLWWRLGNMDTSWLKAYAVAIASLLAGSVVTHNIFKPDLVRLVAKLQRSCSRIQ